MIFEVLFPVVGTVLFYLLYHAGQGLYRNLTSPLRHLDGPASPSLFAGNFKQMAENSSMTEEWRNKFGAIFLFKGLFSISELHAADLKAVAHIVSHGARYQKPPSFLGDSHLLFGKGILSVEGSEHKLHRKILNPAFGVAQIRALTEVFVENSAISGLNRWERRTAFALKSSFDDPGCFNYQFHGLEPDHKPNELNTIFADLFHSPQSARIARFRLAQAIVPILRLMPVPGWRVTANARQKLTALGSQIVSESKANLSNIDGKNTVGGGRDLLSLIVKANVAPNLSPGQRLGDAEVIAQIPTFFLAGHETTSTAASWALHALSHDQRVQTMLRDELLTLSTDNPTMEDLNSFAYLENVVREVMRLHAPVMFTQRMAMEDDVLPLSKPYIDRHGNSHDSLPISKGQMIHVPILAINTDREIWGEDAREFKPERWENIPERAAGVPGVWANMLTFFAGPHNCIGFRFSIVELKALIYILLRAFEFTPAVPRDNIKTLMSGVLQRPAHVGSSKEDLGLPLIVKAYHSQV
ncbi:cytochrome P450 [Mycena filopes]|nr:cytochrome P450 [Mycena filopes]